MAYPKTNWVDNAIPLSAANMNKLETGVSVLDPALFYGKYSQMSGGAAKTGSAQSGLMTFSAEDNDDFAAINLASSTSKIIIPAGVTKVRFYFKAELSVVPGSATSALVDLKKNTTTIMSITKEAVIYSGSGVGTGISSEYLTYTPPIACVAGDEFTVFVTLGTGGAYNSSISAGSIFGMEVLK